MKPPSEKQVALAEAIARRMNVPLPTEFSAGAYWKFINDNVHVVNAPAKTANATAKNPPSQKQIDAANRIASCLRIATPTEHTASAYWKFINENLPKARAARSARRWRRRSRPQISATESRMRAQRRADWEATHLIGEVHAVRVLDGETGAPSWFNGSDAEYRRHLHALGYQSTLEQRLERLESEYRGESRHAYW